MKIFRLVAGSMCFGLAFTGAAFAQPGGAGPAQSSNTGAFNAGVPHYWIADADIHVGSAAHAASVMEREQRVSVQDPQVIGNQAQFVAHNVNRALADLERLANNASRTNPSAVPAIRSAIGQLVAARNQAGDLAAAASNGNLGPGYQVAVRSALAHLQGAMRDMNGVANTYPGTVAGNYGTFGGANNVFGGGTGFGIGSNAGYSGAGYGIGSNTGYGYGADTGCGNTGYGYGANTGYGTGYGSWQR